MRIAESASHQIFERKWHRSYRYVCFSVEGITNLNAIDSSGFSARGNTAGVPETSLVKHDRFCENSRDARATK